jgi:hypothetical protein
MATRRIIKSVLGNFLGTYVSRYTDYDGYLLFGFLVGDFAELRINLLGQSVVDPDSPAGVAVLTAIAKFEDQRAKAHLASSRIREASLTIRQFPGTVLAKIDGWSCEGFNISFLAEATMDDDKHYKRERVEFIAPYAVVGGARSTRADNHE